MENKINDKRGQKDFKGITFSKFKKSLAKKELLKNLVQEKVEQICYWMAEYICAGHFSELWDIIFFFMSKHIHLGNPNLPIYINMRFNNFKEIIKNGYTNNEIASRNNDKIRKLFAEIASVLCFSIKKNSFDSIKVNKEDFDITNITSRLCAKNITNVQGIFLKGDPTELFIAFNEFAHNISEKNANILQAWYWIEWIIEYEKICFSKKKKCAAVRREKIPVENKHQMDIIWIIWEILLNEASKRNKLLLRNIKSLLHLFCISYHSTVKRKRKFILYHAANLLIEKVNFNIPLFSKKDMIEIITKNVNVIYKQIKQNEMQPNTSYLFNNSFTTNNFDKSIEKINKMDKLNYIPRN